MTGAAVGEFALFLAIVCGGALVLGPYLARVFSGERTLLDPVLRPVERLLLRMIGRDATAEMTWGRYAWAFVRFTLIGAVVLYTILRLAHGLPGGPARDELGTPLTWDLSANTAVSFSTTTTWQAYAGEDTMPYLVQLVGLAAQNFLAAAAGLAVGIAATSAPTPAASRPTTTASSAPRRPRPWTSSCGSEPATTSRSS